MSQMLCIAGSGLMAKDFFRQETTVTRRGGSRVEHLEEWMSMEDRHLHVGCADWPIFDPDTNLHLRWLRTGYKVDGLDPERRGLSQIRDCWPHGALFASIGPCVTERSYDCLLIPETIEHVRDVGDFLWKLGTLDAKRFAITTPNGLFPYEAYVHDGVAHEELHPDHNCWYTPFTLSNVIRKYSQGWRVTEMLIVDEGRTLLARGVCR